MSNIGKRVNGGVAGIDVPAWDVSGFYFHDSQVQTGANVRTDNLHLMDLGIYKNFELPNRLRLQIRVEAINALNYTVLWNPNVDPRNATFGFISQDRNNPRDIQIGARFSF